MRSFLQSRQDDSWWGERLGMMRLAVLACHAERSEASRRDPLGSGCRPACSRAERGMSWARAGRAGTVLRSFLQSRQDDREV